MQSRRFLNGAVPPPPGDSEQNQLTTTSRPLHYGSHFVSPQNAMDTKTAQDFIIECIEHLAKKHGGYTVHRIANTFSVHTTTTGATVDVKVSPRGENIAFDVLTKDAVCLLLKKNFSNAQKVIGGILDLLMEKELQLRVSAAKAMIESDLVPILDTNQESIDKMHKTVQRILLAANPPHF